MEFDYSLDFKNMDFRKNPELYRIGRGEQGVLLVEPYKSEILPHWRFKTPDMAKKSATTIYRLFLNYLRNKDFAGADMARKFLQMGFTRARRYANHPNGRKYKSLPPADLNAQKNLAYPYSSGSPNKGNELVPQAPGALTNAKAESAKIFKMFWDKARRHPEYLRQKKQHVELSLRG